MREEGDGVAPVDPPLIEADVESSALGIVCLFRPLSCPSILSSNYFGNQTIWGCLCCHNLMVQSTICKQFSQRIDIIKENHSTSGAKSYHDNCLKTILLL